jgi:hypothetical protein
VGRARGALGFLADNGGGRVVVEMAEPPADSLLRTQLAQRFDHQDTFSLTTDADELGTAPADAIMDAVLEGFLENRPHGVSRLMAFRNVLVKPLGLRTSPLGCPVSSLLSPDVSHLFAGRFPVLEQHSDSRRVTITLGTRVRTRNPFGRWYMAIIDRVHRAYIAPAMLRLAVDHAVRSVRPERMTLR